MKTVWLLGALLFGMCAEAALPRFVDFRPVAKAAVEVEGTNTVRLKLSSVEWGAGLKWVSSDGLDLSRRSISPLMSRISRRRGRRV